MVRISPNSICCICCCYYCVVPGIIIIIIIIIIIVVVIVVVVVIAAVVVRILLIYFLLNCFLLFIFFNYYLLLYIYMYLCRYPDLTNVFAHDYHHAVEHYLTYGQKEHRLGYVEGGFEGRWTISNGKDLFISASATMAGAVDSLVWNHKEFINAWDHGRELQMAINAPPNGECFNPTEAGGIDDGTGSSTKSHLQGVYASGRTLRTSVSL